VLAPRLRLAWGCHQYGIVQGFQRRGRVMEIELTPLHESPTPDASAHVTDADYVARMLAGIDPTQRAVVVLHYYLDLSLPETAAALGIPLGTAKSRLNRALAAMRISITTDDLGRAMATKERFA